MKTRIFALGLILMMALLVGASAVTAEAATFSFTFNGCDGDSVCVIPVTGSTPDSIQWFYSGGTYAVTDVVPPFDTCFIWNGVASGRDSLHMHAWFAAADSQAARPVLVEYMIAMSDGVTVPENGTIGINVRMNDTTSTPDSAWIQVYPNDGITNGPNHGTVDSIVDNTTIWYTPDAGYNGTDDFVYSSRNGCGNADTALVAITITSDGFLSFDSCRYEWVDVPCACDDSSNGLGAISVGDSIRVCAFISSWDLDELTAGWPKVDLPGLAGSNLTMIQDTSADLGMLDTTQFCWPGRVIDSANTWFEVVPGNLDVAAGFYDIISRARSKVSPFHISACTTNVAPAVDNKSPELGSGEASWTLWHDVNGDGIATTLDTMRFFIDLRNEPFEEICKVCVTTYGFPYETDTSAAGGFNGCLYEIAGDNRWALVLEVPPGDLENGDGPFTAVFRYTDNACNVDSVTVVYSDPVDNSAPICANIETHFQHLIDLDSNNCVSLGETVRISFCDTNTINNDVTYWLDLYSNDSLRFGLGSSDTADLSHDSIPLTNLGGGCYRVDWVLGMFPLENAIDTSAINGSHPWVYLHGVDDAGNPFTCDSLAIYWDDPNPNIDHIDARPPSPVEVTGCFEDTTFIGTRAVRIRFQDLDDDIGHFRLFYDNGTGVIDYVDTLAGLNWSDTVGGGGTNGLIHVAPGVWDWTTDGTVELSWCRDYLFAVRVIDACGNAEYLHGDSVLCEGSDPQPVSELECSSENALNICLSWTTHEVQADSFHIYMATNEDDDHLNDTAHYVASVAFTDTGVTYTWCTQDAGIVLVEHRRYDFYVTTTDTCGNEQEDIFAEQSHTECLADLAPPVVCVFQPASLSPTEDTTIYSCDHCDAFLPGGPADGMTIYVRPCNDTSLDVTNIDTVLIRLADSAGTGPGEWHIAGFDEWEGPTHWGIRISCESLDELVREDDSVGVVDVMVISTDAAGRTSTRDQVESCCGHFQFVWSAWYVDVFVTTVNGNVRTYQPECGADGFSVNGANNTVQICIEAGTPPFKIRSAAAPSSEAYADEELHQIVYVENVYARCTTLTFSTVGWPKGLGELDVEVCDAGGHYSSETEIPLCVPDSIPACALIVNPVDGKCIRRSRSMIDPVQVCVQIDPAGTGLDDENVLKIDYQWSQDCCTGFVIDTVCFDTACPPPAGFPEGSACTTFANPGSVFFGTTRCYPVAGDPVACTVYAGSNGLDSTICYTAQADTTCKITVCRLREVPCESVFEWKTFAIQPGNDLENNLGCVDWWNTEDLAWVTESGTIIYLRAIVYDEHGNVCISPCVQVCVDIDTPPLCLWTPDICPSNGYMAIGGNEDHKVTFIAGLDMSQNNIDDLEDVQLWFKKSTDPDYFGAWYNVGSGFFGAYSEPGGSSSNVWRWDLDLDDYPIQDGVSYDWRVIAHTTTGEYAYDYNGDGNFDANTFDSAGCDMNTYYTDITAPQVAMDTVWTTVDGQLVIQPNVSCTMSDPRGWAWTQFGNDITVQPNVYPWTGQGPEYLNLRDDVKRVRWTLFDASEHECNCSEGQRDDNNPFPSSSCFDDECDCKGEGQQQECSGIGTSVKGIEDGDHWVIRDIQDGNPLQNLTFDPSDAPWFGGQWSGVQQAILLVEVWDSCGNRTQDCITLYLLDADPTDAVIVDPINDEVFCTAPGGDAFGGIEIRSAAILEEGWNKAVYAYRPAGTTTWIEFDSVGISSDGEHTWQTHWNTVTWDPAALGLPQGDYELTVWAVDNALNRSANTYIVTVHISCSAPVVAMVYPTSTDPAFIGCDIDVEATATSDDPNNPIERVDFYYVRIIDDLGEATLFGSDENSVDGHWGYHWIDPDLEGPYYIYAIATNRAGQTTRSEFVRVKGDDTDPWAKVIQVGSDLSDGGSSDPTIVQAGSNVTLYGWAKDVYGGWGFGEIDNCGVDSVVFYVYEGTSYYDKVAGFMATPDNVNDSLYTAEWNTTGLPAGTYNVRMHVFDCACNDDYSNSWVVEVTGPEQTPTMTIDGTLDACGTMRVDQYAYVTVTVPNPQYVESVDIWVSNSIYSDVDDQYTKYNCIDSSEDHTVWTAAIYTGDLPDGLYRFRAVVHYTDGTSTDDSADHNNKPDDFTFDADKPYMALIAIDHGVAPFTVTTQDGGTTYQAHGDICVRVIPTDTCDFDHVTICTSEDELPPDENSRDTLEFCFDPIDSSCVTLSNCGVWGGEIPMTVTDALGHEATEYLPIWILDVAGPDTALITGPSFGSYFTPSGDNIITARKLSTSGIDSVQFYYDASQTNGTAVYIGSSVAVGDEFSTEWNVEDVPNGGYYLFARAFNNDVSHDSPRCVFVNVAQDCSALTLDIPNPSYSRTVNGQSITFVGDRVDLCIQRSSINAGAPVDSVVWYFRAANAPGAFIWENDDPYDGWVRIAKDTYGSLCVDWFTDWCRYGNHYGDGYGDWYGQGDYSDSSYTDCCSDGRFTVVAYVFDEAGNVCHSVPTVVNIDNTDPYSEVVDIDNDETFGDCHEIVLTGDSASSVIKVMANAVDISCLSDSLPKQAWASGAKYLQFFAGGCGAAGSGPIDVLFVVDGSNSMQGGYYGNSLSSFAVASTRFTDGLSGRDVQYGVIGFSDEISHNCEETFPGQVINTDGEATYDCEGIWTSHAGDLPIMLNGVSNIDLPYVGGQNDNNREFGVWAIAQGLRNYDWRTNASRIIILVTDEDDDEAAAGFPPIELSYVEQSGATVYTILNSSSTLGYNSLAPFTGGQTYDWNSSFASTFSAITSSVLAGSNYTAGDAGIVWGKQVELTDGQANAYALWNVSGLAAGEYCVWTKVIDQIGNCYTSDRVSVCIVDHTPPTAYIAGFGKSTKSCGDGCVTHDYSIYGQMCDADVDYVQFQYRPAGSHSETDWTAIGIPSAVGCDDNNKVWMTTWNPCNLSGSFEMRVVPTDFEGNQDFGIQSIATVTVSHLTDGSCDVVPAAPSLSNSGMWFEDKTFEQLGLVDLDLDNAADDFGNSMIAVWADLKGELSSECVKLYAPDPDIPSWLMGSFDGVDAVSLGGEGWFWQAYRDNNKVTHLKREVVTVWPVRADIGACNKTHPTLGAKVCIQPGALSENNGIVVFPARVPTVNWAQQHYQAWPAATTPRYPVVTAIHLTHPVSEFNPGKYAQVTIKYRQPSLDNSDLTVGWWDDNFEGDVSGNNDGNNEHGGQWDIEHGILAASPIDDSSGSVFTTNLHGLYAIVSAGRQCVTGALTVENAGMEKAVGNTTGPWPTIYTRVRSNIEFNNGNWDLDEDQITAVLDGNITVMANGDDADNDWYSADWDHVTGILTINWNGPSDCLTDDDYDSYGDNGGGDSYDGIYAPALTAGTHTLYVQAFNDAGYCAENTFTFNVDRTSPNVVVSGYEDCANPTFHIKITDEGGAGVDWENVFVDVFDITGSEFDALPKSRLIHTESYDAFNEDLDMESGEFSFQLISHIAQGRRLRIVIYIGDRYVYFNNECSCEYVDYDHDCDGVQDLVGNRTQIVEEQYTIWGTRCSGDGDGGGIDTVVVSPGSNNPFDPWDGQSISFDLQGFCEGGSPSAEVFDVAGAKVKDLSTGGSQNPVSSVEWNGTNQDEEYVAQGVYLVHFTCTGGSGGGSRAQTVKVVVKRGSGSASTH